MKTQILKITALLIILLTSCNDNENDDTFTQTEAFITTWDTTEFNESITIYTNPHFNTYSYTVDWGDGETSENQTGNATHTYINEGTHTISITGNFPAIYNYNTPTNALKLKSVESWGTIAWESMESAFEGCEDLTINTTNTPNLSNTTTMRYMFDNATNFNSDISNWDVSTITDMFHLFNEATAFNQDISSWEVSNVTDMSYMFDYTAFSQNISTWDVSNVTNMRAMFSNTTSFNVDITNWNVSNVTDMSYMFNNNTDFNQNISTWDVSNVTDMSYMFNNAILDQDLSGWATDNVTSCTNFATDSALTTAQLPTAGSCF